MALILCSSNSCYILTSWFLSLCMCGRPRSAFPSKSVNSLIKSKAINIYIYSPKSIFSLIIRHLASQHTHRQFLLHASQNSVILLQVFYFAQQDLFNFLQPLRTIQIQTKKAEEVNIRPAIRQKLWSLFSQGSRLTCTGVLGHWQRTCAAVRSLKTVWCKDPLSCSDSDKHTRQVIGKG